jgi:pimeloyl-ACP methyl ester carboxylesterase
MKAVYKTGSSAISYTISGEGPAVILIHGFTESKEIWDAYSKTLSKKYRVICPDLPGHGESPCAGDTHTMEFMAELMAGIMDQRSIKEAVITGHSMGGYVSLAFAAAYPERVKGLCLFHSTAYADSEEAAQNRERAIAAVAANHGMFLGNFIPDLFAPGNRNTYATSISGLVKRSSVITSQGLIASLRGMKLRRDQRNLLLSASFPLLFIAGVMDSRVPYNQIIEQALMAADSDLLLMSSVGHMGYIEAESLCLSCLSSFISKCYS